MILTGKVALITGGTKGIGKENSDFFNEGVSKSLLYILKRGKSC